MSSISWRVAIVSLAAVGLSTATLRADDDLIRLGARGSIADAGADVKPLTLRPSELADDDTVPVWYKYRFGYRNFSGFYGGYRAFPRYSYGFGFGYSPRFYYPRYYGGFVGYPRFYGGYSYPLYSSFSYPIYSYRSYSPFVYSGGFCPIGGSTITVTTIPSTLEWKPNSPMNPFLGEQAQPLKPDNQLPQPQIQERTFPYDGGPKEIVPMPMSPTIPESPSPKLSVPEGKIVPDRTVSLPRTTEQPKSTKYKYAAYGEKPQTEKPKTTTSIRETDLLVIKGQK